MILHIDDLVFDAWGRRIFDHASVNLSAGSRVGLVGRNGAGKSTLFRLLRGEFSPGGGEIEIARTARVAAVDQEHPATPTPLLETVLEADQERTALLAELETAAPERMGDIYGRLDEIGADRAPARAAEILSGLGFSEADLSRPMAEFSGGWRMRVAMAAALFAEPDLLLLDEPTNYLDLEGALWLEARLRKYPHAALIISHDRELLDRSVDFILHLHDGKLDLYRGGLSSFERQRAEKLRLAASMQEKIDARRAHMQAFVDRFRASATKARQAQSRLKMIARLKDSAPVVEGDVAPFLLPSPERPLAPPLLRFEKTDVGYGGPPVLKNLNLRIDPDDRIGLLGVNGSGKSTFAKLLAGSLEPSAGEVKRHRGLRVGWFHQHQIEAMDADDTPLTIIRRVLPDASEPQRRSRLAQFGMTAQKVETTVGNLSGGERARLLLNLVAMQKPHLLILDEPTNHLDIDSRAQLAEALNDYEGAVLLIAHDRSMMETVVDRLWLTGGGTIQPFDGDMDDYARHVTSGARAQEKAAKKAPAPPVRSAAPAAAAAPLRRKLEAAEATLSRQNHVAGELEAQLADPATHRDPQKFTEIQQRHARALEKLAEAEAAWMAAAEALEKVEKAA
jgi:ATP-binding cassette, subfamily F, member 3